MNNEWLEVRILDRRCYVSRDDLRIFHGLSGNLTAAAPKAFKELPDDAFIVKVTMMRKWNTGSTKKIAARQPAARKAFA
jgi:hypothetical protein